VRLPNYKPDDVINVTVKEISYNRGLESLLFGIISIVFSVAGLVLSIFAIRFGSRTLKAYDEVSREGHMPVDYLGRPVNRTTAAMGRFLGILYWTLLITAGIIALIWWVL